MKSKITIDLDHDNQPIIKIDYKPSEDVRDSMVKKFLETFGSSSSIATLQYIGVAMGEGSITRLRPVKPSEMRDVLNQESMFIGTGPITVNN